MPAKRDRSSNNILAAINYLGGINPEKVRKAGVLAEWMGLPDSVRRSIFWRKATHSGDTIVVELQGLGYQVENENELLAYLANPDRVRQSLNPTADQSELEAATRKLAELEAENQALREKLRMLASEQGEFIVPGEEGL